MTKATTSGTAMLRRINVGTVLDVVRRSAPAPLRVAELVDRTGLARPTVAQAVDELIDSGWLQQHGPEPGERSLGRPAVRVSLRGEAAPVLGLDVGPHTVTVGISDLVGRKLALVRQHGPGWDARQLLDIITEVIGRAVAESGVPASDIAAAVAGTPGIVDEHSGRVRLVPHMAGWTETDLGKHLRGLLDCPVLVDNDANLAALAIAAVRGGSGTILAIQWGERLGAGLVIDGRLHRGSGAAGELGFITPQEDTPLDPDDGRGPLERAVGASAIARLGGRDSAADVFAAAATKDGAALAAVDQIAGTFARAIAPALLVLDPAAVVIGGGVARAGSLLVEAISAHLRELTLNPPRVELSDLAEDAVVTGAMRMALDEVWRRKLPAPTVTAAD